jgi:protein kinase X
MACGYPPFYGDNPFTVYQKILEARVSYPSYLPASTQAIVGSLLTPNRVKRLGSGAGGFDRIKLHTFFTGIEWNSAARMLLMPPAVPTVTSDGDTSNFDLYPDETTEEQANLTSQEREMFREFDRILDRPIRE